MNNRFNSTENRFLSLEARFETLTGKVIEIGNRLTRVEAILERHQARPRSRAQWPGLQVALGVDCSHRLFQTVAPNHN